MSDHDAYGTRLGADGLARQDHEAAKVTLHYRDPAHTVDVSYLTGRESTEFRKTMAMIARAFA